MRGQPAEERGLHAVIAADDRIITNIGRFTVSLRAFDDTIYTYRYLNMRRLAVSQGDTVEAGDLIGYLSNDFGGTPTTFHLGLEISVELPEQGRVRVPPYMSLVRAYERREGVAGTRLAASASASENGSASPDELSTSAETLEPRIYIHYDSESQSDAANDLRRLLLDAGFEAPLVSDPAQAPSRPQLRYFRRGESDMAQLIADQIAVSGVGGVQFEPVYFEGYEESEDIRENHFEIWFPTAYAPTPRSSRLTPRELEPIDLDAQDEPLATAD